MPPIAGLLRRGAPVLAVVTGAGLLGAAAGGLASVDERLQAAAPAAPARAVLVADRPEPRRCAREARD